MRHLSQTDLFSDQIIFSSTDSIVSLVQYLILENCFRCHIELQLCDRLFILHPGYYKIFCLRRNVFISFCSTSNCSDTVIKSPPCYRLVWPDTTVAASVLGIISAEVSSKVSSKNWRLELHRCRMAQEAISTSVTLCRGPACHTQFFPSIFVLLEFFSQLWEVDICWTNSVVTVCCWRWRNGSFVQKCCDSLKTISMVFSEKWGKGMYLGLDMSWFGDWKHMSNFTLIDAFFFTEMEDWRMVLGFLKWWIIIIDEKNCIRSHM